MIYKMKHPGKEVESSHNALCLLLFFNCYLAAPWPTLGHSQGDRLTNPMLITVFELFRPKGHWEPCSEVGSLSLVEHLVGF